MIKTKKSLGQHFLIDEHAIDQIAQTCLELSAEASTCIEIGPGSGNLTQSLVGKLKQPITLIELDARRIEPLREQFPSVQVLEADFLKVDLKAQFEPPLFVVGNFPYNISSQIVFKLIETGEMVHSVVGMFQKEVADRLLSQDKGKGVLTILAQAYFQIDRVINLGPRSFRPPPKVDSTVITLIRNKRTFEEEAYLKLKRVVKLAFGQRRKTLKNSLSGLGASRSVVDTEYVKARPEELSVQDFLTLTNQLFDVQAFDV